MGDFFCCFYLSHSCSYRHLVISVRVFEGRTSPRYVVGGCSNRLSYLSTGLLTLKEAGVDPSTWQSQDSKKARAEASFSPNSPPTKCHFCSFYCQNKSQGQHILEETREVWQGHITKRCANTDGRNRGYIFPSPTGLNELIFAKCLEQSLEHSKHYINVY